MGKWKRGTSGRQQDKGAINFMRCYQLNSRGSGREIPQPETTPSLLSSLVISSSFSLLSLWRIAIITTTFMCCGHCVYRLRKFLVTEFQSFPQQTQREALSPTGIISSGKCRLKELRRGWLCVFFSFLSVKLVLPPLIDTGCTVKCRGSVYRNIHYFPLRAEISI